MLKITLKSARINAGFTQKEVAEILGVADKTVWNWENYITYPNGQQIEQLCELYGIAYDNIKFTPKK